MIHFITLTLIIAGAIGGLLRTLTYHGDIVWPSVDLRGRTLRLGFIASVLLGAFIAYLVDLGVIVFLPEQTIDDIWTAILVGVVSGFLSLHMVNRLLGTRIDDPDTQEFGLAVSVTEKNPFKRSMYDAISHLECVERVLIGDEQLTGAMKAVVVPRVGVDPERAKMKVENILNKMRHPGIQLYVYLPEEVIVNIALDVLVKNGENDREMVTTAVQTGIQESICDYIDSLQPGEPVLHSQIVHRVIRLDRGIEDIIIVDAPGDSIIAEPAFQRGRIIIGDFQVARCGVIRVKVRFKTLSSLS